ncbi:hypothetical protein HF313_17475 [Massilia atriviolacea]|uniref:Sel1 repeat family protein n=1 Tax=Massilia atriviolacea TaxID=2495579 RepID=A0A430HTU4_9BURK|nr:hypothetical protein [Massilia atriviolacea]RSZ60919.1 hypothetical protein EJB06_01930 [Massilia atriviolacea]
MMKRRIIALACVAAGLLTTSMIFSHADKGVRTTYSQRPASHAGAPAPHPDHGNGDGRPAAPASVTVAAAMCPPMFGATVAMAPEQESRVLAGMQALIAKQYDVPTLLQLSQQGNTAAALLLFQRLRPCSEATRYVDNMEFEAADVDDFSARECAQLPDAVLRNPIGILLRAADAGSAPARILISKNAPTVASVMAIAGDSSTQAISELRTLAERYGLDAARSGSESAMAWLAHSYLTGAFGRKDAASAYAITHAWARSGSAGQRERLAYLRSHLSASELNDAHSLLKRCSVAGDQHRLSIFASPFN